MKKADHKKSITEYVKTAKPRSTAHKVLSQDEYLDGVVAEVEFQDNGACVKQWVVITQKHKGYADSESQLIQQMGTASKNAFTKLDWINQIFNIGGIIALVLVATASYLTITNTDGEIPEHLKASLLTITGFYFGGLIQQKRKKANEA